jgi:hypothetical protein
MLFVICYWLRDTDNPNSFYNLVRIVTNYTFVNFTDTTAYGQIKPPTQILVSVFIPESCMKINEKLK